MGFLDETSYRGYEFLAEVFSWVPPRLNESQWELPENRALTALVLFAVLYWLYYLLLVVGRARVVGGGSQFRSLLLRHCPSLSRFYWPTFWAYHAHLTTVLRPLLQRPPQVTFRRDILVLKDGGEIALDWAEEIGKEAEEEEGGARREGEEDDQTPVMLIVPGLTGCSGDSYVRHMAWDGLSQGYRPVVFSQRGNGGVEMKTPRTYCSSNTEDLREVLERIRSQCPSAPITALGVSLGGMILVQYLHETGSQCVLKAVMAVSMPWDPFRTKDSLEKRLDNRILYSRFLTSKLKDLVKKNVRNSSPALLKKLPYVLKDVLQVQTVSEFDELVTVPMFGYSSLNDYYSAGCGRPKIKNIQIPFFCITAADDPFVPKDSLPLAEFEKNPLTVLAVTSHGGHFGFLQGVLPRYSTWMNDVIREFLHAVKHL